MAEYKFDAARVRDTMVEQIRLLSQKIGFKKAVLGISGGKDSTVTAALLARALGKENVYGVMIPDGVQSDINDSERVCEALGIRKKTVNIGAIHSALTEVIRDGLDVIGQIPKGEALERGMSGKHRRGQDRRFQSGGGNDR